MPDNPPERLRTAAVETNQQSVSRTKTLHCDYVCMLQLLLIPELNPNDHGDNSGSTLTKMTIRSRVRTSNRALIVSQNELGKISFFNIFPTRSAARTFAFSIA